MGAMACKRGLFNAYWLFSVGSYVIPWKSRVNSCHLRFSGSEFQADSQKIGWLFFRSP